MVGTFPALFTLYEADNREDGEASDGGFHDGLSLLINFFIIAFNN